MILFGGFLIGCNITCMMVFRMPHLQDSIQQLASRSNPRRESQLTVFFFRSGYRAAKFILPLERFIFCIVHVCIGIYIYIP